MYSDFQPNELLYLKLAEFLGNQLGYAAASAVQRVSIDGGLEKVTYTITFTVERSESEGYIVETDGSWQHVGNTVAIGK